MVVPFSFLYRKSLLFYHRILQSFLNCFTRLIVSRFYINLMKKKQNNKIQDSMQWTVLLQENEAQFMQKTNFLRRWVKIWHDDQKQTYQPDLSLKNILIQYASYIEDFYNKTGLLGNSYINPITYDQELKKVKTEKQVYLGYDFFDLKTWKINFSHQFIHQLQDLSFEVVQRIFTLIYIYTQGYIPFYGTDDICLRPVQYYSSQQKYYETSVEVQQEKYLFIISIGVQKVPIFSFKTNALQSFQFQSFIQCESILKEEYINTGTLVKMLDQIQMNNEYNPKFDFIKQELCVQQQKINVKVYYYDNKKTKQISDIIFKTYPYLYKNILADKFALQNFDFMLKRHKMHQDKEIYLQSFIKNEQLVLNQHNINQLQKEIQKHEFLQFQHAARIIEILQQIPNFKYQITNQQRQVLSKSGNLIVVGRSGTGKTTCAMLRLYGIQYITKKRQINRRMSQSRSQIKQCQMSIFEQLQLSKNIFLTFSPILIQEIKNQYTDMLYQIKQKHVQKCQKCKTTFIKKQIRKEEEQDPIDKMKRQLVEQEQRVTSLNSLNKNDYPAFFTIQNFIRMIDKTIQRPFYDHQLERKDKKSLLARIVKSYINKYIYTSNYIDKESTIYAVYVDFYYFNSQIWPKIPKQFTKASKEFSMLTSAVVWSQIFSIIKGSVKSYTCPDGCISLKMYLQQPRNIFQNYQKEVIANMKIKIYSIFKVYQNWCKQEDAYDLMDVVNHLLKQTQFYGYNGPKMNYVFIDEVQDLTTATVFLLSKLVINNIFYCGDTAQAITKGVDFRFQDLKLIFSKDHCKNAIKMSPPEGLINLTVNFRSHNRILQLANSIISSIQEIFPNNIGKIKRKEQSDLFGPKPFIILKRTDQLFDLLCGPKHTQVKLQQDITEDKQIQQKEKHLETKKQEVIQKQIKQQDFINKIGMNNQIDQNNNCDEQQEQNRNENQQYDEIESEEIREEQLEQYRKFNSEQVIIVRNMEQARLLPPTLKEGIVLTPERAKGLQYDQIVLFNFFSSSPCFQKWSILDHFYIEQSYEQEQKFQEELSRRSQEQTGKQQQLNLLIKSLLEYDFDKKKYKIRNIRKKPSFQQLNLNQYYELVTELKMLYTIITRARSVFVIYDSKIPKCLVRVWEKMNLTVQINDKNIVENRKDIEVYTKRERHVKYLNEDELWMKQGATMLHRKQYENAKKCFKRINRSDIVHRIQAMQLEMKAQDEMHRLQSQYKKLNGLGRQDKKIKKVKLDRKKRQILAIYIEAAKIFDKYKRYQEAANSYEKSQDFINAIKYYQIIDKKQKMAQCCFKLKLYEKAIQIFSQLDNIQKLIQCYVAGQKWVELFQLLLKHRDKTINKIQGKDIADNCVYKVLHNCTNNAKINQQKQNYLQFYALFIENKKMDKCKYNPTQFKDQIRSIFNQNNYWNYKQLLQKMISIKQHYDRDYKFFKQQQTLCKKIKQEIVNAKDKLKTIKNNQQIQANKLQKLQNHEQSIINLYYEEQQQFEKQNQINSFKYLINRKRSQLKKDYQQASHNLNSLSEIQIMQDKKLLSGKTRIKDMQRLYDINRLPEWQKKLTLVLKNVIKNNVQGKSFNEKLNANKINQQNKNNSMIGIHLFPPQKLQIIEQIKQVIKISEKIINYSIQSQYQQTHHRYIEAKIQRQLAEKQNISEILRLLNRCDSIGQNMCCLLICDYYKELVSLTPRYIMNFTLQMSSNYKYNRFIKNNQDSSQETNIQQMQKFLINIDNQTLSHKIPHFGLKDHYYYRQIVNDLVTGIILQGYFKIAFLFCEKGVACQLAYLFSSYELLIQQIKRIATLNYVRLPDKKFLFITDQLILKKVPESKAVNIFSIQNIFYAYDECEEEPFLSKKITIDDIAVQQTQIIQILETKIQQRQAQLKIYQNHLQRSIQYKRNLIKNHQNNMILNLIGQQNSYLQYSNQRNQLLKEREKYQHEKYEKHEQIKLIQTQKIQALKREIDCKLSKKQKLRYQQAICAYLFSHPKRQDDNVQPGQIQIQYKNKLRLQFDSHSNMIKIQSSLKLAQKQQQFLKNEIHKITAQIYNYDKMIKTIKPQALKNYFKSQINTLQISIDKDKSDMPKQLLIVDKQQRWEQIQRILIKQYKERKYKQQRQKKIKQTKQQISKNSNIPSSNIFLTYYLKGQLKFGSQDRHISYSQIDKIYMAILKDGNNIDSLEQKDETICNILIFYMSYLFKISFRDDVSAFLGRYYEYFLKNQKSIQDFKKQLQTNEKYLQFCNFKSSTSNNQKEKYYYQEQKKKTQKKRNQLNVLKQQQNIFEISPKILLQSFLEKMFSRIKTVDKKHNKFMEILFGFFQCRIINDCPPLKYLQHQYLLARSNSIVVEQLKKLATLKFCYFFDHQKTTVLCHYNDIQKIILNRIEKRHKQISSARLELNQKQLRNANNQKYIDKEVLGYALKPDNKENRQQLIYHTLSCPNYEQKQKIQYLYEDQYISSKMTAKIKKIKRSLLQFYFENQFEEKESFHFVQHQLNEYQFLQQMYIQMDKFNVNQLMKMQKKLEGLEIAQEKWLSNAKRSQGKPK